jgi:hypothetical protein
MPIPQNIFVLFDLLGIESYRSENSGDLFDIIFDGVSVLVFIKRCITFELTCGPEVLPSATPISSQQVKRFVRQDHGFAKMALICADSSSGIVFNSGRIV